jgi:hypothetical protein
MVDSEKDKITKKEIIVFVGVLVVGILVYFLLFGMKNNNLDNQQNVETNIQQEQERIVVPTSEGAIDQSEFEKTGNIPQIEGHELKPSEFFKDVLFVPVQHKSKINSSIQGVQLKTLYTSSPPTRESLYIRLELYDNFNPDLQYHFDIPVSKNEDIIVQILFQYQPNLEVKDKTINIKRYVFRDFELVNKEDISFKGDTEHPLFDLHETDKIIEMRIPFKILNNYGKYENIEVNFPLINVWMTEKDIITDNVYNSYY